YFLAIVIFVSAVSYYTYINWKPHPAIEPTVPNCNDLVSENFLLRELINIDSDSYHYCEETLPLFQQCGHPMTDS
ncbi:unnamed protein product, partial [Allacma fusca]